MMTKRIVLCADDYGQALPISQGILNLIKQQRLSATSCLVTSPHWVEHAKWLIPYQNQIDIGLHFNLTEGIPLSDEYKSLYGQSFFSLPQILRKSVTRSLDQAIIERECEAQLDHFEAALGRLPAYIDGHQHVHQFPVIRDALVRVYEKRLKGQGVYIRLVNEPIELRDLFFDIKKIVIYLSGTRAFKQLLERHQIPHNSSFAGIYAFSKAETYPEQFPQFLTQIKDRGLIMCHPGLASTDPHDVIGAARAQEYAYFSSDQFITDCHHQAVKIARFAE